MECTFNELLGATKSKTIPSVEAEIKQYYDSFVPFVPAPLWMFVQHQQPHTSLPLPLLLTPPPPPPSTTITATTPIIIIHRLRRYLERSISIPAKACTTAEAKVAVPKMRRGIGGVGNIAIVITMTTETTTTIIAAAAAATATTTPPLTTATN